MKKTKIIAFVLVVAMAALALVACTPASPRVKINCTISIVVDGEKLLDSYAYTVSGTEEKMPTVLQTVREALTVADIQHEADDEEFLSVTINGKTYARGMDEENVYSWIYTVNGKEPTSGRMHNNVVEEGASYELELISIPLDNSVAEDEPAE